MQKDDKRLSTLTIIEVACESGIFNSPVWRLFNNPEQPKVTGISVSGDQFAIDIIPLAEQSKRHIPNGLLVCDFDDLGLAGRMTSRLTTV